jgi:HSP20 family protein
MSRFSTALLPVRPKNKNRNVATRPEMPLENLFHRFFGEWLAPFAENYGAMHVYDFDVSEDDKEFVVKAELPGFEDNEIDVTISDNMLTIKAEKETKGDADRAYRSFYRTVTLPFGIESDKIRATYRNGVLEMHLPRPEDAKVKHIPVKAF